jgi:hypothetical protein
MTTPDIDVLLHAIKPDGHGSNPLAVELHRLANALQEQTDKMYAVADAVRNPQFKGDVVGELAEWDKHFPMKLDHTGNVLNGIFIGDHECSEWLAGHLWDEANTYIEDRFSSDQSPQVTRTIARMDKRDLHEERAA